MSAYRFKSLREWEAFRKLLISEWFPGHIAERTQALAGTVALERLVWRRPGTGINRIDYVCDGPHLFVTGDLGDAIYEAGARDLAWWSNCDAGYFASKCVASEYGRGYREWDPDAAYLQLRDLVFGNEDGSEVWERLQDNDGPTALCSEGEWSDWVRDNADEVWGDGWRDLEPWNIGRVISMRCEGHLAGLKLAMAQLASAERAA